MGRLPARPGPCPGSRRLRRHRAARRATGEARRSAGGATRPGPRRGSSRGGRTSTRTSRTPAPRRPPEACEASLLAVPLRHAPDGDDGPGARSGLGVLEVGRLEQGVDRVLLGLLDEPARVDEGDIGVGRVVDEVPALCGEPAGELLQSTSLRVHPSVTRATRRPAARSDLAVTVTLRGVYGGADPAPGPRRAQRPALGAALQARLRLGPARHRRRRARRRPTSRGCARAASAASSGPSTCRRPAGDPPSPRPSSRSTPSTG